MFVTDDEDNVARAIAIRCEEKGGIYYNNEEKINNEKVAVADIAQFVAQRTMSQYEEEFEVVCFSFLKQNETDVVLVVYVHLWSSMIFLVVLNKIVSTLSDSCSIFAFYQKLPYGLIKPYTASQLSANLVMNRYKGIYPCELNL